MSDLNDMKFKSLSDDEELERLLESIRRDIGEASPEPAYSKRPAEAKKPEPAAAEAPAAAPAAAPSAAEEARRAQPIRQPRPNAARRAERSAIESRPAGAAPRRAERRAEPEPELPPERERLHVAHPEEERERRGHFGLAFGIFTALLFVVLAAGCTLLWFYLDAYEATRPGRVMDEFTELADEQYWADALETSFTVGETPFEDRDELMEELCLAVLRENPLTYREDELWSEDNLVYIASAGDRDVCRVTLGPVEENGDAGFGFNYLSVQRVELLAEFTAPAAYEIDLTVPAGSTLAVNGVTVTPDYIADGAEISSESIGELEESRAAELYTVYHIGGLYAPVEVYCAGAEGGALSPEAEPEGNSLTFALPEGGLDYRILVPEGGSVSVNGVELDESYKSGESAAPAFLEGFEDYGTLPELELWLVEGLHLAPELEVRDAGGEEIDGCAVDGEELVYFADTQTIDDNRSDAAADFAEAYIGYITGGEASEDDYDALQDLVLDGSRLDTALAALHSEYEANGYDAGRIRLRSGSFVTIGSTCFVCTVDVEYSTNPETEAEPEELSVPYTIVMVMYGGAWYAAEAVS